MATDKHTVSIYVDQDLLEKLNEFKTNGEYKSLNVALNSFLRESFLGEVSGNVQSKVQSTVQSTLDIEAMIAAAIEKQSPAPDVDIESMINEAIAAKLSEIKDEIKEEYGAGFRGISANITDLLQQRDREIDALKADIQALKEATAPANFTQALLQKNKEVAPLMLQKVA
jgi:hypothetical protein